MYSPKFNLVHDRAILLEAMREYAFATLFGPLSGTTADDPAGATHLPLVVKDVGEHGVIEGHFAKANPHWRALAGRDTLVVFAGPHSYVSPTLYVEDLSVPTWNYIAIHARGTLSLVEDDPGKEALLADLIAANEPAHLDRWNAQPAGFRRTMCTTHRPPARPISSLSRAGWSGSLHSSRNRIVARRGAPITGSPSLSRRSLFLLYL
jgi:transcriptional regulator